MTAKNGNVYGYGRVSAGDQNLDRQLVQLQQYVAPENIVTDKASGKDLSRPGYTALKGVFGLRKGDTLVITSLDRLSRNKEDIKNELQWFREHGIRLKILDLPTSLVEVPEGQEWILDMINNILIEVLSSIAEQERKTIRKRQREGIEAAKQKGKHLGRPCVIMSENFSEIYKEWKSGEITAKGAMRQLGMTNTTFYRKVHEYEAGMSVPKGVGILEDVPKKE